MGAQPLPRVLEPAAAPSRVVTPSLAPQVLVLSSSKSYIFVIFFKQFFGICVFGTCLIPLLHHPIAMYLKVALR